MKQRKSYSSKDGTINRRYPFSHEEDYRLSQLVEEYGNSDWLLIASMMEKRNSRQCRERWINYLSPDINTSKWTPEEDELLMEKYKEIGSKWVQISKFLEGRTEIMVKNRFQVLQRRLSKEKEGTTEPKKPGRKKYEKTIKNQASIPKEQPKSQESQNVDDLEFQFEEFFEAFNDFSIDNNSISYMI
ncbi:Myb-like DNA-binding domain containing protein [Histomonas meleagridis]|uniref:Myb-like DNA-binding domain containing protein n=1 Tax=Histomonas meleagridis TaxID=135588 RepID=UPI00355A1C5A|nr:Myb-like DNA-binding domain containing protein [Histomonas meleagridis]KAH0802290.1 Myb-like DNA-binding domain containing protein [Histomonas meleagridis]